jgi:hypothetical protein
MKIKFSLLQSNPQTVRSSIWFLFNGQTLFTHNMYYSAGAHFPGTHMINLVTSVRLGRGIVFSLNRLNILIHFTSQLIVSFSQFLACWVINLLTRHTAHSLINQNATVTSLLPAGTGWLTTMCQQQLLLKLSTQGFNCVQHHIKYQLLFFLCVDMALYAVEQCVFCMNVCEIWFC